MMCALKLGVRALMDEVLADEFYAMLIIAEEWELLERKKIPG
jgi:hypothetical protein